MKIRHIIIDPFRQGVEIIFVGRGFLQYHKKSSSASTWFVKVHDSSESVRLCVFNGLNLSMYEYKELMMNQTLLALAARDCEQRFRLSG